MIPEPTPVIPDGETVTPTDDIQTWLKCGGMFGKPYTTVEDVLEDTNVLSYLISDKNAVDYMVRSTLWADDICTDQTAMSYIGLNNYCANTLLSDETWCEAICDSEYFESVLNVKVPVMTSDTEPSGIASCSSTIYQDSYMAYKAFDGTNSDPSDCWHSKNNVGEWIQYQFINSVCTKRVYIMDRNGGVTGNEIILVLKGSDDGITFKDIASFSYKSSSNAEHIYDVVDNNSYYSVYRISSGSASGEHLMFGKLQFYGREDV